MKQEDTNRSTMNIQWYPGHMTKTRRMIEEDVKLVDAVCEILDARIPIASRNPDIDAICGNKPRMIVLNRIDMADPALTKKWAEHFRAKGYAVLQTDCKTKKGISGFVPAVRTLLSEKLARYAEKGQLGRPLKLMVVGIPNVGKSTFINSFAGKACAKTGNKPGVTKGNQWIRLNKTLELLDTPGILWPKFEDPNVGLCLAFIGSINDEILDKEELAAELIKNMSGRYGKRLEERYGVTLVENTAGDGEDTKKAWEILREIARARSCLLKGSELDTKKAAGFLLDDFRSGKLGRVTLEVPEV